MKTTAFQTHFVDALFKEGKVFLSWNVINYKGKYRYSVQRSADGRNFKSIGVVDNTAAMERLSFTDEDPLRSNSYYRITEIQKYGTFYTLLYSNVCKVQPENLQLSASVSSK